MDFIDACIDGDLDAVIVAADALSPSLEDRKKLRDGINKLIEHDHYGTFTAFCTKNRYDFINIPYYSYYYPCTICAQFNRLDMLKHSHDNLCDKVNCVNDVIEYVAEHNNFEMLEYIVNQEKIERVIRYFHGYNYTPCESVAEHNRMEMLIYLHQKGFRMNKKVCLYAAQNNNVAMLEYGRIHGFSYDEEMMKYADEPGIDYDEEMIEYACIGGSLQMVTYLHDNECPWDEGACAEASREGHIIILTYLHENGCPWDSGTLSAACVSDDPENIECLEYAYNHGVEIDDWAAINCALFKSNSCLDFILTKGAPLTIYAISAAAQRGDLEMVIKLRQHDCPWDARVTYWARHEDHDAIYDYAVANNCPLPAEGQSFDYCVVIDYDKNEGNDEEGDN